MNKKRVIGNANGFILADVMLGMFILVVALTAIAGLYVQSSKASIFADNRTAAYNWAQERMEFLKSRTDLKVDDVLTDAGIPPRTGFERSETLEATAITALPNRTKDGNDVAGAVTNDHLLAAVNSHLIHATVTVSWPENGVTRSVSLETLIEQN